MSSAAVYWLSLLGVGWVSATVLYGLSRRVGLIAVVDTLWSLGIGLGAVAYWIAFQSQEQMAFVVLSLVILWSSRLTYHLITDRVLPGKEDPRYARLAKYWGAAAPRNFLFLFWAQVPLVAIFLIPITVAMSAQDGGAGVADFLAVLVAVVAFVGEGVADRQLSRFRSNPENRGGVCQVGLWRYSRHPNYFFEWLHWWAYVFFAWGHSSWLLTWIGPLVMFLFLRYISGVPPAEKSSLESRGSAYRQYQKTTNAFFPWKPQKAES
tara:strand:+ start:6434 stop:7228 length:795 start_codon:yes stop_codon:yes gene_type:complete